MPLTPIKIQDVSDVEDEDVIYFCPNCDSCPVCDSPPKATQAATTQSVAPNPTNVPARQLLPLSVPLSVPIVIFMVEGYFQGGWWHLIIPYLIAIIRVLKLLGAYHRKVSLAIQTSKRPNALTTFPKLFSAYHRKVSLTIQTPCIPPKSFPDAPKAIHRSRLSNFPHEKQLMEASATIPQSAGSELDQLADFVLGMTLNDEGPTPANQPSKLFTSRQSFQADRSSHIPTTFIREAVTMADATASISALLTTPAAAPSPHPPRSTWREQKAQSLATAVRDKIRAATADLAIPRVFSRIVKRR
ncbi:hypothetical protein B0H14DRAFT_2585846 [Mycena olivaceomarginata]|nr:hypothetical protein B0H14DRAFT_2585846 [Mycena olivaceomarginata]